MSFGTMSGVVPALEMLTRPSTDKVSGLAARKVRVYLRDTRVRSQAGSKINKIETVLTSRFRGHFGKPIPAYCSCQCLHPKWQPWVSPPSSFGCTEPLQSYSSSGDNLDQTLK